MNYIAERTAFATVVTALGIVILFVAGAGVADAATPVDGISFADERGTLYAPIRSLANDLEIPIHWDAKNGTVLFGGHRVPNDSRRTLFDGQQLVAVRALSRLIDGTTVDWDSASHSATVSYRTHTAQICIGEKKVWVNRRAQRMRAYQGNLLVLDTAVSTGRLGHRTPKGQYNAGPLKARMLISHTYNNAKMPYSVQIRGDYVIHGYTSVPDYPASHGCVRVPLTDGNPARWFYNWVNVGTPIVISDTWQAKPRTQPQRAVTAS